MLRFVLLAVFVSSAAAIQCYSAVKLNNDKPDSRDQTIQCYGFCTKATTQVGSSKSSYYGCDTSNYCTSNGISNGKCRQVQLGRQYGPGSTSENLCCCNGNLCNSAENFPMLVTVVLTLFLSVFV